MKYFVLPFLLSLSTLFAAEPLPAITKPVPLFDGKTLAGWEGKPSIWRVEDGMLVGGSLTEDVKENDFLASTRDFGNFIIRFKIKLTSGGGFANSGFQIRSQRVPNNSEMSGYQCDYGDPTWWAGIYDESRRNTFISPSDMKALEPVIKRNDWNEYTIRAVGPRITTWLNGVMGTDYTEADPTIPNTGKFGIQVHAGGKTMVQVKDMVIEELPAEVKVIGAPEPGKAAKVSPLTPEEERATFSLPPGFEIELVASEDVANGIGKFVPLAFDQHGALWTTTALEYPVDGNENPAAADALYASKAKDKVLVFDRDPASPTGLASKPRVFAEGLAIPLGVLPYKNGCYVQHGHDIAFLEDTDGDGKADKRTVILTGFGVQDSHLFPHQFLRAPGGYIWMAQGAFNYSKVSAPGEPGKAVQFDQTRMAKFRLHDRRLYDGSGFDGLGFDITSNGPCNIWGLVLNGEGEAFIQEANDFGYPVMPFHEYANYPGCSDSQWKSYAPEFPGTAPDFRMGGTGLSGLAILDEGWAKLLARSTGFQPVGPAGVPPAAGGSAGETPAGPTAGTAVPRSQTVLVANPITNRIQTVVMHRDGPRWRLDKPVDFLRTSDESFRPVATTIGPDGCLYIVDWYNKIISHNEVPRNHPERDKIRGRIWRVKATAQKPFDVPDFTKLSGDALIAKLGGESLAQSHLAWQAIGDREMKELAPKLREIVSGVGQASRPPGDASRVVPANVDNLANAKSRPDVPRETPGTAGGTPTLPAARRIAALWALESLSAVDGDMLTGLYRDFDRNVRREAVQIMSQAWRQPSAVNYKDAGNSFSRLSGDDDPEVRAAFIGALTGFSASVLEDRPNVPSFGEVLELMLRFAQAPLSLPVAPSTRNGKPIKVREAYDREFERYLVRMCLEKYPDAVAKVLDSNMAQNFSIEGRLLASLALEPKASAASVAKLLPQLQRAPGQEEVLRLAQFPEEPGVGAALKATLRNPATRNATLEALLATRTKLNAAKLTPFLGEAATELLASDDPASLELGVKLATGFQLANAEPVLVALLGRSTGVPPVGPAGILPAVAPPAGEPPARPNAKMAVPLLRALATLGSGQTELFASLAMKAPDAAVRDEALAALATSKAADAPTRLLGLYPKLTASARHTALDRLAASKSGAKSIVAAVQSGAIPKTDLDAATVDKMQAVLGDQDAGFTALTQELGMLFRPVLALDGSKAAWTQTNVTLDGPCTVETWIRLDPQGRGINNADGILGAPNLLSMNFYDTKFRVFGFDTGDLAISKKPMMPGLWTHVAATRNAAGLWKIYLDGEFDSAATKADPRKIENVRVAWTPVSGARGALAEFRIWNRERTLDEIRATSDRSIPASTPGLLFSSAASVWGKLEAGAKIVKTSDLPPILNGDEAAALDAKYVKNRALANEHGDPTRGKNAAAVCQACHLMGTAGGNIGPNLSGVGAMGTEGILRNVLQPNAALENGYRTYRVELKNGDLVDALYVREDNDAVIVRMPGSDDRRIPKSEIREAKYLRRSLMPEGLLDGMSPEQVTDLFAFLKTLK